MRRNILFILLSAVALASCQGTAVNPAVPQDKAVERRVEKILRGLTLEEKIGQMTQLQVDLILDQNPVAVDEQKLDEIIENYKVGSFLNCPFGVAQTPETYVELISHIQEKSIEVMGIPCIYGLDQNHGASYTLGGTFFPQEINLGASFNPELATTMGEICAYETRASYTTWTFNPTMDLGRNPVWPRIWESFGEDAYVNAEMGKALALGYQGEDPNNIDEYHIAACVKHFMGYGVPVSGQDRTPAIIAEPELREKYFEPFKETIVKAHALSLMVNSGSINGMPVHANAELLSGWLKKELNWDGMIVTDWADINNLYQREKVAKDEKDAIRICINAGVDMSMVPYSTSFCVLLKELVEEGEVPMSRIDDACRRVLRLKMRLGLFDNPMPDPAQYEKFACEEFAQASYRAALETQVLLKNEGGILPLKAGSKILLAGPNANAMRCLNGGWTNTWQNSGVEHLAEQYNTIYEAFCNRFGASSVKYVPGVQYVEGEDWNKDEVVSIQAAVAAARSCDVIVACVGENSYTETPGNLMDLNLSANQKDLVKALAAVGKPMVLVLNEGRPRVISDIEPLCDAIVDIFLPGNYGGDALAALMSGDENFSGRMPITYPKYVNRPATYDYKVSEIVSTMVGAYNYSAAVDAQWVFGDGLSYTEFQFSDLTLDKTAFTPADELTFTVTVTNTGAVAGKVPVLLYSSDLVASCVPDSRRLRAFTKVALEPGESTTVEFKLPAARLAFVGYDKKWHMEKGEFVFVVADQFLKADCTADKTWQTPNIY